MKKPIIEIDFAAGKPYWDANKKLWEAIGKPDGADPAYNRYMTYADEVARIKVSVSASRSAKHRRKRKHPHRDACIKLMRRAHRAGSAFKEWMERATHENGVETLHITRCQNRYTIEHGDTPLNDGNTFSETTLRGWWTAAGKRITT